MAGHDQHDKYPRPHSGRPSQRSEESHRGYPQEHQQWGQADTWGQQAAWGQPDADPFEPRGGWQQPPPAAPPASGQTPGRKPKWYRRTWVMAVAALLVGVILGNATGGGDPEQPAAAAGDVQPQAATPGSCLRVIDLARGGKVSSQEFEASAGDCRSKAAGAPAPATGEQPVAAEEPPAAEPEGGGAVQAGQPAKDGKFTFVVGGVECGTTTIGDNEFLTADAQGEFCLVSVNVTNHGNEAQYLTTSSQVLVDAQDREYAVDDEAWAALDDAPLLEQINPGLSVDGTLVFDVPPGTQPVAIRLHDSPLSGGVTVTLG